MKVACSKHGVHFGDEFEAAYKCGEPFKTWQIAKMPKAQKKVVWDWIMAAPFDEVYLKSGYQMWVAIHGQKADPKLAYANEEAYQHMSDEERREHQRRNELSRREQSWSLKLVKKLKFWQ